MYLLHINRIYQLLLPLNLPILNIALVDHLRPSLHLHVLGLGLSLSWVRVNCLSVHWLRLRDIMLAQGLLNRLQIRIVYNVSSLNYLVLDRTLNTLICWTYLRIIRNNCVVDWLGLRNFSRNLSGSSTDLFYCTNAVHCHPILRYSNLPIVEHNLSVDS